MTNPHHANNESSLQTLMRAIELSQGEFYLILVRCNYTRVRDRVVQQLQERSRVPIRKLILPKSVETLYTTIETELREEQPSALMVLGLESIKELDRVLTDTNFVREKFKNNFPFPLVLLVNSYVQNKLIRLAPDFENWGTSFRFVSRVDDLVNLLEKTTDQVFAKMLEVGAGRFLDSSTLNLKVGSPQRTELELAQQALQSRGISLSPELQASLEFVLARMEEEQSQEKSLEHYQKSLDIWQQVIPARDNSDRKQPSENHQGADQKQKSIERLACVLYSLGVWYSTNAERNRVDYGLSYTQAKDYFQQCVELLEENRRPDLVAKFINALGAVLHKLKLWDELEDIANQALILHQTYHDPYRIARAYAFLAEVALTKSNWQIARQLAQRALELIKNTPVAVQPEGKANWHWVFHYHQGWYLFALARAEKHLGFDKKSLESLEAAKRLTIASYDPNLYISILKELREAYLKQNDYLRAFEVKQYCWAVERDFNFRTFIGANRLQPQTEVDNPAFRPTSQLTKICPEIATSGRERDIKRLLQRIRGTHNKLTIIHGQSGVGKSSLLQAGLIPVLQQEIIEARTVVPICQQVYTDWIKELGTCLSQSLPELGNCQSIEEILGQLRQTADNNLLTVLIFDQFEEFFLVYQGKQQRQKFYWFLQKCLDIPYLNIILSLREDYLHYLLECNRHPFRIDVINNDILSKTVLHHLGNFTPEDADNFIENLTKTSQFCLEDKLVSELVNDLSENLGEVRPIELQIVGTQLQTEKITTLQEYRNYGSKDKLVESYLTEIIKDCGEPNQYTAQLVLYLLIDEENNTRPLKTYRDLQKDLKPWAKDLAVTANNLSLVLEIFVRAGLVLQLAELPAQQYQLVHDYLVPFIRKKQGSELRTKLRDAQEQKKKDEEIFRSTRKLVLRLSVLGSLGFIISLPLAITTWISSNKAIRSEVEALNSKSHALFLSDDLFGSLLASLKANQILEENKKLIDEPRSKKQVQIGLLRTVYDVKEINRLPRTSKNFNDVGFSLEGKDVDKNILRNLQGEKLVALDGNTERVLDVKFSPDGKIIAVTSADKTVKIWNLKGEELASLDGNSDRILDIKFSHDGKKIAIISADKTVKIWDIQERRLITLKGHADRVLDISFSPNGQTIATASADKTVKLWSSNGTLLDTLKGHRERVARVKFDSNGERIISASADNIKIWQYDDSLLPIIQKHEDIVYQVSFSKNVNKFATASADGTAKLWNRPKNGWQNLAVDSGRTLRTTNNYEIISEITSVAISPDGNLVATASDDGSLILENQNDSYTKILKANKEDKAHQERVNDINFSPDGEIMATASYDGTVKLWSKNGEFIKTLSIHTDKVVAVNFSPNGKIIATASDDETVILWFRDGTYLKTLEGGHHTNEINDVSFSPDGKIIATASDDKTIKLWSLTGDLLTTLESNLPNEEGKSHSERILSVEFKPQENNLSHYTLASASFDKTIRLWKIEAESLQLKGKLIKIFRGHEDWVWDVSFTPDGKMLASASSDYTVRFWSSEVIEEENLETDLEKLREKACNHLSKEYLKHPKNHSSNTERGDLPCQKNI